MIDHAFFVKLIVKEINENYFSKDLLIQYLEDYPEFGYERGQEIMRYVPYSERRRRNRINPPPPPPIFIATGPTGPPPSVNPPSLPVINETPPTPTPILTDITNPFLPGRELPRTPTVDNIQERGRSISSNMSLFRR